MHSFRVIKKYLNDNIYSLFISLMLNNEVTYNFSF